MHPLSRFYLQLRIIIILFYFVGHFEAPPYNSGSLRTAYHVRSCDVYRLGLVSHAVIIIHVVFSDIIIANRGC